MEEKLTKKEKLEILEQAKMENLMRLREKSLTKLELDDAARVFASLTNAVNLNRMLISALDYGVRVNRKNINPVLKQLRILENFLNGEIVSIARQLGGTERYIWQLEKEQGISAILEGGKND